MNEYSGDRFVTIVFKDTHVCGRDFLLKKWRTYF